MLQMCYYNSIETAQRNGNNMIASSLKSGMTFWDSSKITVLSETKCFMNVLLVNNEGEEELQVPRKWKKTSNIILKGERF